MNSKQRLRRLSLVLFTFQLPLAASAVADTGPEYLDQATGQQPIEAGFQVLLLPYAEERHNLLHLRSFYLDRTVDGARDGEEWAGGGWLELVTDFWEDRFKLGATAYTSQKLWADDDKLSIGLLQPGHDSYSALGELYGSLTLGKVAVQAGRYLLNMPYINASDIRMTPNTFEGAKVIVKVTEAWTIGGGILSDIKTRTSTDFEPLYEVAGLQENEDVTGLASIYERGTGTSAGIYYVHAPDYMDSTYVEVNKRFQRGDDAFVQLSGQYTWQESEGAQLDGDFEVKHYGLRATWKRGWYSGSLAWTDYPEDDPLRRPWGSIPGYTSVLIKDFDRPGETAWLLGGTADLSQWGAQGFKVNLKYIDGDTPDCGTSASPDQNEWDLNLDYAPPQPALAGLALRLRLGWVDQDDSCNGSDAQDVADIRFIVNYPFEF